DLEPLEALERALGLVFAGHRDAAGDRAGEPVVADGERRCEGALEQATALRWLIFAEALEGLGGQEHAGERAPVGALDHRALLLDQGCGRARATGELKQAGLLEHALGLADRRDALGLGWE